MTCKVVVYFFDWQTLYINLRRLLCLGVLQWSPMVWRVCLQSREFITAYLSFYMYRRTSGLYDVRSKDRKVGVWYIGENRQIWNFGLYLDMTFFSFQNMREVMSVNGVDFNLSVFMNRFSENMHKIVFKFFFYMQHPLEKAKLKFAK